MVQHHRKENERCYLRVDIPAFDQDVKYFKSNNGPMSFIHMTSFSFRCAKAAAIENKIRTRHSFRYWSQLEWSSHLSNPPFIIAPRRNAKKFYDKKDKSVVPAVVPKPKKEKKNKDKKVKK